LNARRRERGGRLARASERRAAAWLTAHARALFFSLGHLARAPLNTALTAAVLGIALALPAGLAALLNDVLALTGGWNVDAQVSLYLRPDVGDDAARVLAGELEAREDVARVELIPRAAALEEYRQHSGFGEALALLEDNPLPAVLVLHPSAAGASEAGIERLLAASAQRPEVDLAHLDRDWIRRLHAIAAVGRQGVTVLGALLAVAVFLVVGNTIRLGIANRREEIEIAQLFGATDAFVRRPFLYHGLLLGAAGGLIGWAVVAAGFALLRASVAQLASLYGSEFALRGPGLAGALAVVGAGAALGLGGAWLAVGRHLAEQRRAIGTGGARRNRQGL